MRPISVAVRLVLTLALAIPFAVAAADGDLDPGFSIDGSDVQDWGVDYAHALAVATTSDGAILVGGQVRFANLDFGVVRYRPDGTLDAAFGDAGLARIGFDIGGTASDSLHAILPLPDGKTLLVGSVATATVGLPGVARLTAAGEPDPDFGIGGKIVLDLLPDTSTSVSISRAARQADGSVVLLGTAIPASGSLQAHIFLLRIDENGVPDPTFSGDGWTLLDIPNATLESGDSLAIDDAGRIHVGANAVLASAYRPFYFRVGTTGLVEVLTVVDLGETWVVADLALDPVGGRVLLSLRDNDAGFDAGIVVRLDSAGNLDGGFGTSGIADLTLEEGSWMSAIALQSDGRIVLAGHLDHTGTQQGGFFLARLLPGGARDASFDGNGVARYEFDREVDARDGASALALAGGRLVAAGYAGIGAGNDRAFAVLRTQSALIFTDGFERGSSSGWRGN